MVIYFLLRHDLLRYIILHSLLQAATHQYTMVNPMVCCQAAAGLHLLKGAHCTPVFSSSQFRPIRTMIAEGTSAVTVVSVNREIHVGVKAFHGSYELACKREVRCLDAVGIPSFYFYFFGVGVGWVGV
jgi:hypothetical protein